MMKTTRRLLFILPLASAIGFPVYADDNSMDEIVISAHRVPTPLDEVASSITLITQEDLANQQIQFLSDAFQRVPGMSVSQNGPRGSQSSIRIRGGEGEDTLVLIDGVEVSDPSGTRSTFDFGHLMSNEVERIEVLRGSQSTLYGGDAVGGVIQIITKRGGGDLQTSLQAEGGSYGSYLVGGRLSGGALHDKLGYTLEVKQYETDGFSSADTKLMGNEEKDGYQNLSINGRLDYDLSENISVKGVYRSAQGHIDFDWFGGAFGDALDLRDEYEQRSGRLSAAVNFGDGFFTGEIGYGRSVTDRETINAGSITGFFDGDRTKVDFQGALNFNDDISLVFGAEWEEEELKSMAVPVTVDEQNIGVFVQWQQSIADRLFLSAGARIDDYDSFGSHDTYRVTAAYQVAQTDTKLKATWGTGFRAPSLFELFGECCGEVLGNPDLEPETSESWDIGFEQRFLEGRGLLEVVYFRLEEKEAVTFCCFGNGAGPNYMNVPGESRSEGVEVVAELALTEALDLAFAYTYTDARDASGARFLRRPENVVNGNVTYRFLEERGTVNLNVTHVEGSRDMDFALWPAEVVTLDAYTLVNLAASYQVLDNVTLYARGENLTDENYQTVLGFGTAGIAGTAGVRVRF